MDWQDPKDGFAFSSAPQKAATICKNLRKYNFLTPSFSLWNKKLYLIHEFLVCVGSLLGHAESLIPTSLNEEDVQLLR